MYTLTERTRINYLSWAIIRVIRLRGLHCIMIYIKVHISDENNSPGRCGICMWFSVSSLNIHCPKNHTLGPASRVSSLFPESPTAIIPLEHLLSILGSGSVRLSITALCLPFIPSAKAHGQQTEPTIPHVDWGTFFQHNVETRLSKSYCYQGYSVIVGSGSPMRF